MRSRPRLRQPAVLAAVLLLLSAGAAEGDTVLLPKAEHATGWRNPEVRQLGAARACLWPSKKQGSSESAGWFDVARWAIFLNDQHRRNVGFVVSLSDHAKALSPERDDVAKPHARHGHAEPQRLSRPAVPRLQLNRSAIWSFPSYFRADDGEPLLTDGRS
jgi:hypothetical protein